MKTDERSSQGETTVSVCFMQFFIYQSMFYVYTITHTNVGNSKGFTRFQNFFLPLCTVSLYFKRHSSKQRSRMYFSCIAVFTLLQSLTLQVSVSVGKKILMLFNINDPDNRIDLTFQHRYGNIVSYRWYCTHSHIWVHPTTNTDSKL